MPKRRGVERVLVEARPHGMLLARPLSRAFVLGALGVGFVALGWPLLAAGATLLAVAAVLAIRAVWRWEWTRLVVTTEMLLFMRGALRRKVAEIRIARLSSIEVEQGLVGRLFGYGTLVVDDIEIPYVARPRELSRLLD